MFGRNKREETIAICPHGCGQRVQRAVVADHYIYAHLTRGIGAVSAVTYSDQKRREAAEREQRARVSRLGGDA